MSNPVIVVGGGLAGFSAANTVLENGGSVLLLDKSAFCGGNSAKATSGINGSETKTQKTLNIEDSNELFQSDCMKGGAKQPELVKVMVENSGPSVDWLMESFDLDLSLLARLGGHSAERTHRGKERFPGMTITYAQIQMAEKIAKEFPDRCRIVNKARVTELLRDANGTVNGVVYIHKGKDTVKAFGPVILASGGFAADLSQNGILASVRPDLLHLATSNGEHCTGDGIKMGQAIGAQTVDLEFVQVHPTGLVNPKDPNAKVMFLAAEALRGVGGLLLDADGNRFVNELHRRDHVSNTMFKNKGPFRLVLNSASTEEIHWHCEHYKGRNVMKQFNTGAELAKEMGIPVSNLEATFKTYNEIAKKQIADPVGGPHEAYPSGKTHDPLGKKFFKPYPLTVEDNFHVAVVTPLLHYTMGGLKIDTFGRVIGADDTPIDGLYAAGEIMGGVHGNNRLGGNSLLDCVVFGRITGKHCAQKKLCASTHMPLKSLSATTVTAAPAASKAAPVVTPAPVAPVSSGITLAEVAKHNTKDDCWVVVNGDVLDVTDFLADHPGGELAIMTFAGRDASHEFNMIHPGDVVEKYTPDAIVGQLGTGAPAVAVVAAPVEETPANGFTIEEVAKHNTKEDCWVVVNGDVLDVTEFLADHPGGELAILTFAGRDASHEFNMIHPSDVVEKYTPEAVLGPLVKARASAPAQMTNNLAAPLLAAAPGEYSAKAVTPQWWGEDRYTADMHGPLGPSVSSYIWGVLYFAYMIILETVKTIFTVKNYKVIHDKSGLTRSAMFMIVFVVIHGLGNIHMFFGPDHFNGYAYFLNHPCPWGTLLLPVEIYLLVSGILHVIVATVRTYKFKSMNTSFDQLWLAVTGVVLFVFLVTHLLHFRLVSDEGSPQYYFRAKWMYPFFCDASDVSCDVIHFKDLYKMEFIIFESFGWVLFYEAGVLAFFFHLKEGIRKVIASHSAIPRKYKGRAQFIGMLMSWVFGLLYFSYPLFCYLSPVRDWAAYDAAMVRPVQ